MIPLHDEQKYVLDGIAALGVEAHVRDHCAASVTAEEKAALLGWDARRIVKAVYAEHKGPMVGFVSPTYGGRIPVAEILTGSFGLSGKKAKAYAVGQVPEGMMRGTCTPFPRKSSVGPKIQHIFVIDDPELSDTLVDISLGGTHESDLRRSLHLPYGAIYPILSREFKDYVRLVPSPQGQELRHVA